MNDQLIMNSTIHPSDREGLAHFARQDAARAERHETEAAERQREERERQAAYAAVVRQTVEAFRSR